MSLAWPPKDPDETLDYSIEWADRLEDDSIDECVWTLPAGLSSTNETRVDTLTTIYIAGGILGESYIINCRITTAAGRVMEESAKLKIKAR